MAAGYDTPAMRYFPFSAEQLDFKSHYFDTTSGSLGLFFLPDIDKLATDKGIWLNVEVLFVSGKRPA